MLCPAARMESELTQFWRRFFHFNWRFGLFLVLLFCVPRFILVLHANLTANYRYIGLMMICYALAPFIFLNKRGRQVIGLTKPTNYSWLLPSIGLAVIFSFLLYWIGQFLFDKTFENWYVYIGKSYNIPVGINPADKAVMFAIVAIMGMMFSPIGEELFFRGMVHSAFARSMGNDAASAVDSAAFALTHISHFGLIFVDNEWKFVFLPAVIWVMAMFALSMLFHHFRRSAGSLLGAIVSHAAFNLGMTYCIFYLLH